MIDVTNVVSEFKQVDLQAYVNQYAFGNLLFKNFFPSQFTTDLTFQSLTGDDTAKVMADIVSLDSRAPRKGRAFVGKYTGDIPKIEVERFLTESDIYKYRALRTAAQNSNSVASGQAKEQLVNFIFDDATFVLNAVNARIEWLAKQACSTGEFSLTPTNNAAGAKTQISVKFGIPSGNITNSGTDWYGNPATATPITDIKAIQATATAAGLDLQYMFMEKATFDKMSLTTEVQKYFASLISQALSFQPIPTLAQVNSVLSDLLLPTIIIWNSNVNQESKAGTRTAVTGWEPGRVLFSQNRQLGNVQWTTSADAEINVDVSQKAQNDFVLVKRYAEQNPITVMTKGIALALPVLQRANQLYILKTKQS